MAPLPQENALSGLNVATFVVASAALLCDSVFGEEMMNERKMIIVAFVDDKYTSRRLCLYFSPGELHARGEEGDLQRHDGDERWRCSMSRARTLSRRCPVQQAFDMLCRVESRARSGGGMSRRRRSAKRKLEPLWS